MTTAHAKSIAARIKRVANERGATYGEVMTEFLIERAAVRLVSIPFIYKHLIFKGGFVGLRVYGSPRFTTDLDAVIHQGNQNEVLKRACEAMVQEVDDHVWFVFEREIDLETQNEYGGTRLQFRAGLGLPPKDIRRMQIINIDIGTGDPVTPSARAEKTPTILGTGELSWCVYPIETIIAEKLHPLVRLGQENSRSKYMFDLAFYLPNAKPELLKEAIAKTFACRSDLPPTSMADFLVNLDLRTLRRGWRSATASIRPAPDFDHTVSLVIEWLRRYSV